MVSTDLLVFLVAVVISCISGLSYLTVDYFKGRKNPKGETHAPESEQKTIQKLRKGEDGDSFKKQIPQASSASNIPKVVSSQAPTIVKEREVITREVVLIQCAYCGGLMPQASTICPHCSAKRKI